MAVQARLDQSNIPFILEGKAFTDLQETILTDGSRTVPLYKNTIMAQVGSSRKWVPWLNANLAGTTGTQTPLGIYVGDDITAAALVAGDVVGPILRGGNIVIDEGQLVFDLGSTGSGTANTLDSIPTVPTNQALTARALLHRVGIWPKSVIAISAVENT